jgi:opacity protein-like surface antigen
MKSIVMFLIGSTVVWAQPVSVGVKGGLPLTDFLNAASGGQSILSATTNRYIVGPSIELRLPAGFGVEFDALYRRFSYNATTNLVDAISSLRTTGNNWEFPLLLKKRFAGGPVRPFVSAGVSWNKISGLTQSVQTLVLPNRITNSSTSSPVELKNDFSTGFVLGGGLDLHLLVLRITPEIRYTRWGNQNFSSVFSPGASLNSSQNQAEFLVGFSF